MRRLRRDHWQRRIAELDPEDDFLEIHRITIAHEFPWDTLQALSLALLRTYAVPSIGGLLATTGEFTGRTRKRYDDTALLLEAVLEHGFDSTTGRDALRRVNQMHAAHDLDQGDLRYVLSTLLVGPKRWLDAYGWRPMSAPEVLAAVRYYRTLGARLGVRDLPATWDGFARLHDDHERAHFGYDEGGRAVAEATLGLLATLPPTDRLPGSWSRLLALSLMDVPLLDAFRLPHPPRAVRTGVRLGLRVRARALRLAGARRGPAWVREQLAPGCPVDVRALGSFPPR